MSEEPVDVLIVGAGAAGAALAWTLAETRLRIVNLLAHRGELCVCDVESILEVSQSKASRHLTYLKNAGVVTDRRDGAWVYYRLLRDTPVLKAAVREIKKALASDAQAQGDLAASESTARDSDCSPIGLSRKR